MILADSTPPVVGSKLTSSERVLFAENALLENAFVSLRPSQIPGLFRAFHEPVGR